ncbi:unnamed protein product [Rotaria sp. Silwood2]|nr:unnamed protein product [Rotaria sp. Silwood2]
MWNYFNIVVVNDVKQDMVCCQKCKQLFIYRAKDGTAALVKHNRSCENVTTNSSMNLINQAQKVKIFCTEFIALDSRPFELVSGDGFVKLAQSIFDAGKYFNASSNIDVKQLIPSPVTISRNIDNLYEIKKNELKNICMNLKSYCIICDFWTERYSGLSYCGLALRFATLDFQLHNFILGCILEIDKRPVGCNKVQNVFQNVKQIVTHVRRTHRQVKLKQKLQLYSDTRFNGAFYMLNVFLNVYDDLGGVLNGVQMEYLTNVDKELLEELCDFLKVFDESINQLSEEERPTIYKVLPIRQLLLKHCEDACESSSEIKELKSFLAPEKKTKAFDLVKQELLARALTSDCVAGTAPKTVTIDTSIKCNKTPTKLISIPTPVNELDDYMALDEVINETDDVLLFWKRHSKSFPILSMIARDLFAIPASNTIVERLFSASKNIVTDRRTSLAEAKLNKLLFLKKISSH